MADAGLYASPTFLFRDDPSVLQNPDAARGLLRALLSTQTGTVLSAQGYGLPPLSDFDSDTANEEMVQAIRRAIETYLPQLERHFGSLHVTSEVEDTETVFVVFFKYEEDDEEIEVSTRYIDARWVVLNK